MKNNKSIYIVGIFMLITMVSIGYAILTGQLNINGSAKVKAAKWDIYFKNVKVKDGSVTASVKPSITDKTTVNFEVELSKPGDFYEFNIDVVNDGMIDAMVESINITPELTTNQQKYLSYSVTYFDDVPLEVKDILHSQKARTLKVRVEYNKNIDNGDLLSSDETLNIKATIKYVQADNTAKESLSNEGEIPKFVTLVTGDGTHVGDELAIGDEHFYVISNDGTNITMLSKYNLLSGVQNSNALGMTKYDQVVSGGVVFSSSAYWENVSDGAYVYDNRASISTYVDNYKNYLESFGVNIIEARLIKKKELISLGCPNTTGSCKNSGAPSWVYSSAYWTGTFYEGSYIYRVLTNGALGYNPYSNPAYGVRPVIVISVSEI